MSSNKAVDIFKAHPVTVVASVVAVIAFGIYFYRGGTLDELSKLRSGYEAHERQLGKACLNGSTLAADKQKAADFLGRLDGRLANMPYDLPIIKGYFKDLQRLNGVAMLEPNVATVTLNSPSVPQLKYYNLALGGVKVNGTLPQVLGYMHDLENGVGSLAGGNYFVRFNRVDLRLEELEETGASGKSRTVTSHGLNLEFYILGNRKK